MTQKNSTFLAVFLLLAFAALSGASILKGGLYLAKHEGDTIHLMELVFRMASGETPHYDFMTPIGALSFWPIAMLVKAGQGIGMAFIWSQVITALVFLPIVFWVARSRLTPFVGGLFGLLVLVLLLALVHGEAEPSLSVSMHYNRQAWAAAYVAIVVALIPPVDGRQSVLDGVIVGLMVSVLAMIKMTYLVSFALPILLALILTKQTRALAVSAVTGAVVMAGITVFNGVGYWAAYAGDLLAVLQSDLRSAPGESLDAVIGSPAYLGASLSVIAAIILLRQAGAMTGGLIVMLLMPGFFYVTYQNYGNDPQWLPLLAVLILAFRADVGQVVNGLGWNLREALGVVAAVAMALAAPSFFNLASSPFRHLYKEVGPYASVFSDGGVHSDVRVVDIRVNRVDLRVPLDGETDLIPRYAERDDAPELLGETLPVCTVELGLPAFFEALAQDLEQVSWARGSSVFVADLFSNLWLFGDLEQLAGGAPWYYGGAPGLETADYMLVPLCPVEQRVQIEVLEHVNGLISAGTLELNEVRRTDMYILYEVQT